MSVKHIKKEYIKICQDYKDMLDTIHELEEAVAENVVSEERLEELKKPIEKLKENWMRWNYIIYLLDMPNKKQKKKKWERSHVAPESAGVDHVENKQCITDLKNNVRSIK